MQPISYHHYSLPGKCRHLSNSQPLLCNTGFFPYKALQALPKITLVIKTHRRHYTTGSKGRVLSLSFSYVPLRMHTWTAADIVDAQLFLLFSTGVVQVDYLFFAWTTSNRRCMCNWCVDPTWTSPHRHNKLVSMQMSCVHPPMTKFMWPTCTGPCRKYSTGLTPCTKSLRYPFKFKILASVFKSETSSITILSVSGNNQIHDTLPHQH